MCHSSSDFRRPSAYAGSEIGLPRPVGVHATPRLHHLTHRLPTLPIVIDGKRAHPSAIRRHAGRALHTVVDHDALAGEVLQVFTDREKAEEHIKDQTFAEPEAPGEPLMRLRDPELDADGSPLPVAGGSDGPPGGVPPDGGYVDLYEHQDWGGCTWRVLEWEHKTVRDYRDLWACGFLAWGWRNANDQITCIDAMISGAKPMLVLAEHILLGGSWIWFPGRAFVPSLVPYGWNDRASSQMILYF
jgi:hypothetical protein